LRKFAVSFGIVEMMESNHLNCQLLLFKKQENILGLFARTIFQWRVKKWSIKWPIWLWIWSIIICIKFLIGSLSMWRMKSWSSENKWTISKDNSMKNIEKCKMILANSCKAWERRWWSSKILVINGNNL